MKFRCSFITNSSSSSFILGFKSIDEIENLYPALPSFIEQTDKESFIRQVKDNIIDKQEILTEFYDYCFDQLYDCGPYGSREYTDDEIKKSQQNTEELLKKLEIKTEGLSVFSVVSYGDDTNFGSCMENDVLPTFPHTLACLNYH